MKRYFSMIFNILKYVLIYLISQFICGIIIGMVVVAKYQDRLSRIQIQQLITKNIMITTVVAAVLSLSVYILLFRNKGKNLWIICQFKKISIKNSILVFLASIGVAMIANSFIFLTQNIFKSYNQVSEILQSNMQSFIGTTSIVILIPIFEEILFRGLIFNELRKHMNLVFGIILQAIIFAFFHGNIVQGGYAFIVGIIAAFVYIYTKSILGNIFFHCAFNLMAGIIIPVCMHYIKSYVIMYMTIGIIITLVSLIWLYGNRVKNNISTSFDV